MDHDNKIRHSAEYLESKGIQRPRIGIILGSGLGDLADSIENSISIDYKDIPNFPVSTVEGHAGRLVFGVLEDSNVVVMQGRFHYYEGYHIHDVVFPVRVMMEIGIDYLIVTNAAGGVNKSFEAGDLMLITDHINFAGVNPLMGNNLENKGPRFVDMSFAYSRELLKKARNAAKTLALDIKEGVYMWFSGPTYETPAEVKLASLVGADAVGMSTVPEVIVANHQDIEVVGISCITNMAAGILDKALNHDEVVETSRRVKEKFESYVREIIKNI